MKSRSNQQVEHVLNVRVSHTQYLFRPNPSAGPQLPMEQTISFQDSKDGFLQSFKTFLPKIYAAGADRSNRVMFPESCFSWLQTRSSVHFVFSLTIESPQNFVIQTLSNPRTSEILMFSQWIETERLSSSLHSLKSFTSLSSANSGVNTLVRILLMSRLLHSKSQRRLLRSHSTWLRPTHWVPWPSSSSSAP